jgi:hypothetical protein
MYFNHPYALRNTPEILELRSELGFQAYAIYLMVLETIAESKEQAINGKLVNGLSISFGCDVEFLKKVLTRATELKLFYVEGDFILSTHLQQHFEKRAEIKQKRIEAGAKGGNAKANAKQNLANPSKLVANAKQPLANAKQNLPKESKESKINKNKEIISYIEKKDLNQDLKNLLVVWIDQRTANKKLPTIQALEISLKKLFKYDLETQIKMVENSVENSWTGIFEIKQPAGNQKIQNEPSQQTYTLSRSKFSSDKEYEIEIKYYQEHHKDWKLILTD